MSRIAARFDALQAAGRGALIPFLTAFDPDRETSLTLLRALPEAGADLIEIGMPFSDPVADGPTIQAASRRALAAGARLATTLDLVASFRCGDDTTPIILMGYLNPIEQFGVARFCEAASVAGVDGLIVVDLPPEEADLLLPDAGRCALDVIRLVAPTTDAARLPIVLSGSSGFVYYVSIAGVTGTRTASGSELEASLPALRRATALPVAIGFGIRTPDHAATAVRHADAVVVASALIQTLASTLDQDGRATAGTVPTVLAEVRGLAEAVHSARVLPLFSPEDVLS